MAAIVKVDNVRKTYEGGFEALKGVSLDIEEGEILALLGPNGAGKTTLISTICGITVPTSGAITVGEYDVENDYREARRLIGLVPQEIAGAQKEIIVREETLLLDPSPESLGKGDQHFHELGESSLVHGSQTLQELQRLLGLGLDLILLG